RTAPKDLQKEALNYAIRKNWDLYLSSRDKHYLLMKSMGQQQLIRDIDLLESAFYRPKFMFFYEKASIYRMAAGLGESIIKNQPFLDGNKRAGHLSISAFLFLNGYQLRKLHWVWRWSSSCPTCHIICKEDVPSRPPHGHTKSKTEGINDISEDPYMFDESDPMKRATLLLIWQNHYLPNVATLAKIFQDKFNKQSYNLENFLDPEISKKLKKVLALAFEKPKVVLSVCENIDHTDTIDAEKKKLKNANIMRGWEIFDFEI
ncbi:3435_t:CDS:2, partial [Racocetra persica]